MRARVITLAGVAAVGALVTPTFADGGATATPTAKPQIVDATGDANFINGQGVVLNAPSQSTPVQQASADITSVLFQSTFTTTTTTKKITVIVKKKKVVKTVKVTTQTPTGFTVTMNLAAAPGPETEYRVIGITASCTDLFFEYSTDALVQSGMVPDPPALVKFAKPTQVRCAGTPAGSFTAPPAVIKGSSITWTVPASSIPVGTKFTSLTAETRVNPFIATIPAIDLAAAPASTTFTVGQ